MSELKIKKIIALLYNCGMEECSKQNLCVSIVLIINLIGILIMHQQTLKYCDF